MIEAPPAQEADQSSVSPRLRGGEEEEEDSGEEGRQRSLPHTTKQRNLKCLGWLLVGFTVKTMYNYSSK